MMNKMLLLLLAVLLSPTLFAQYVPPTMDRQAVTTDADGALVGPSNFFDANAHLINKPIIDVADNAAKLALTDIQAGQRVRITGEGNRVEMYLGEGEETVLTGNVVVSGAGTPTADGIYVWSEGHPFATNGYYMVGGIPDPNDPEDIGGGTYIQRTGGDGPSGYWVLYIDEWEAYQSDPTEGAPYSAEWGMWPWWDEDDISVPPPPIVTAQTTTAVTGPEEGGNWVTLISGGRRYPVFQIDVPYGSGLTDFELKGSISNFTGASIEDKIVYYYHSPDPDLAQSIYGTKPLVWFTRSGADTIVHRQQPGDDSIYSTLPDADSEVGSIYVIVRGDDEWLYPGNPALLWGYVLFDGIGPVADGATPARQIWRAIRPVEWITPAEIPSFLDQ